MFGEKYYDQEEEEVDVVLIYDGDPILLEPDDGVFIPVIRSSLFSAPNELVEAVCPASGGDRSLAVVLPVREQQ